jgi:hypothetical protein
MAVELVPKLSFEGEFAVSRLGDEVLEVGVLVARQRGRGSFGAGW